MRRSGPRKPGKHFSTYTHDDHSVWEIRTQQKSTGFGYEFFCYDEGVDIRGDNPETVIMALKAKLMNIRAIDWKPMIHIEHDSWRSRDSFNLSIERMFVGKPEFDPFEEQGRVLYRTWEYEADSRRLDTDDRLDIGKPGRSSSEPRHGTVVPYTPEIWTMLRAFEKACVAIHDRVTDIVSTRKEDREDPTWVNKVFKKMPDWKKAFKDPDKYLFEILMAFLGERRKKEKEEEES